MSVPATMPPLHSITLHRGFKETAPPKYSSSTPRIRES
jgi:hypothetical protein